ncbi:tRNA-specific adenosine deaminase,tRNA-specific adenosine deaminase,Pyrimidine deaminase,riboflavin biosynthesis protein RibD,Cytidine and deoxycytidylate deaminase zinc-binding region [Chlamydia serpentis]|uniref:tRNA-specific adenosine deaminase n=1 Tax=Chlamydia serpentis TaxID=1967782 RepID=A0A2R8FCR3_9CHLA|nr:tRNA adenosine(34) deaminase TadA [Chlamydia serpentis]SPN74106.1 tRNA-specific adenosine deaminase,tRNA-specific adenosine deaminase,Pyrimidine deaminase,riboflavin biosynthesis protein RibD,Cytidine and deoxycytidylate deaminase zinc-binding region [Chlamydia serpentis]
MDVEKDTFFMQQALKEARKAYNEDEVPVGCIIVKDDKIIARGHNSVEQLKDPTAHAEILCIGSASAALDNWRLTDTVLYCTLEPCLMCAGAMQLARISRLVWGAPDLRLGAGGSWIDIFTKKHPFHALTCTGYICVDESENLMKQFFTEKRKEKSGK